MFGVRGAKQGKTVRSLELVGANQEWNREKWITVLIGEGTGK
jgi:hypothetical protein